MIATWLQENAALALNKPPHIVYKASSKAESWSTLHQRLKTGAISFKEPILMRTCSVLSTRVLLKLFQHLTHHHAPPIHIVKVGGTAVRQAVQHHGSIA